MKTAQRILLIISGIGGILAAIIWFIVGMVFMIGANSTEFVADWVDSNPELTIEAAKALLTCMAVIFLILMVLAIVSAVISFKASGTDSKGLLIVTIVFGVLSGVEIAIVGAIFGLIARNQKQ